MRILTVPTVDTTDEELSAHVNAQLATLATEAAKPTDAVTLAKTVGDVAEEEGIRAVFYDYRECLKDGLNARAALDHATRTYVLRGADDQWSGRTGDVRRSRFDGILRAVDALRSVRG